MNREYRLPILSAYYQDALETMIWENDEKTYRLTPSQITKVRPVYRRLRSNPVWNKISERGEPWALVDFAKHIMNGDIIANHETFLWYLIDRYEDRTQITLMQAAEDDDCIRWHFQDLVYWLNGLSIRYPDLINFWSTHGGNCITFQRAYLNH